MPSHSGKKYKINFLRQSRRRYRAYSNARQARVVAEGVPHHFIQRGNNRHPVFRSDDDRIFSLATLRRSGD
jgi:hypothetical protein